MLPALLLLLTGTVFSQSYSGQNISMVSIISPNTSTITSPVGNQYSGCWGWFQQSKNKEYAISGASNGTYFIDISNPSTPSVSAFVSGKQGCTWRELKTYSHYCYIASDDALPNRFQIVDMQYLPDSVHVVHDTTTLLRRAHTLWIDGNKLYAGAPTFSAGFAPMAVYSLATPTAPVLLRRLDQDFSNSVIDYVHDMYARNDTIYASAGYKGLFILKHDVANDTITLLGSYTSYANGGYNHSSFLTQNGKHLLFCDEVPESLPIHMIDVQNLANIQSLGSFHPLPHTTPHNPYLIGNNFAVVSCYQDGVYIYDISQPGNIKQAGYFDTYPQGGANTGNYGSGAYNGNWGAYPYLPSGLIVASDMQNGILILNPAAAYTTTTLYPVNYTALSKNQASAQFGFFPNPADKIISVSCPGGKTTIEITNAIGQTLITKSYEGIMSGYLNVAELPEGIYFLTNISNGTKNTRQLIVRHE